jgi:hypothetical protein
VQGAVRPALIVVSFVLAQDPPQMVLVPDKGAVQELAAVSPGPALAERRRFDPRPYWAALAWRLVKLVIAIAVLAIIVALAVTHTLPWQAPYKGPFSASLRSRIKRQDLRELDELFKPPELARGPPGRTSRRTGKRRKAHTLFTAKIKSTGR